MEEKNETTVVEDVVEEVTPEEELAPETDWEAEAKKARGIAQRLKTKLEKATEAKVEKPKEVAPVKEVSNSGELDETQLDYLDLKGITDSDEIEIIKKVMTRTGQTVRQALKDDYVSSKLESLRKDRAVKDATPSATKRGGSQSNDIDLAMAKYESTGKLPDDYALRSAVVNKIEAKTNTNKPSWQ